MKATVRELIERLQDCDPDAEVYLEAMGGRPERVTYAFEYPAKQPRQVVLVSDPAAESL